MKKIIVKIEKATGKSTVEAVGFNGVGCKDATKGVENALGGVTDRTAKPVMWNQAGTDAQQTVGLGGGK